MTESDKGYSHPIRRRCANEIVVFTVRVVPSSLNPKLRKFYKNGEQERGSPDRAATRSDSRPIGQPPYQVTLILEP
ncbi:hypothetical protein Hanom_Chr01g00067931 [Helianthus anomalus]